MAWTYTQTYDEYYDFDKELYRLPDALQTSVDLRLTFNVATRTCYLVLTTNDDHGRQEEHTPARYIDWGTGVTMLRAEGMEIPEELI